MREGGGRCAVYGLAAVFLYVVPAIVFLVPTSLVSAELASGWDGGVYNWVSRGISGPGAGRVSVMSFDPRSRKYVQVDGAGGRIVNWHNQGEECQMATRHNGMDVPMKIPAEADETVIETGLEVDTPLGTKAAKPVRWPKAS